jgi:three-Cys-motif partner protein
MTKKEYGWDSSTGTPPLIGAHSRAKHRILSEYLQRYFSILAANPRMDRFRISCVDGFAGGGLYTDERNEIVPGSPLILLDGVCEAGLRLNLGRTKTLTIDAEFILVERNREVVRYLQGVLAARNYRPNQDPALHLIEGRFEDQLDGIITRIKSRGSRAHRAIFVLDQYGYTGVPVPMLRKIFDQLPNAEVFLTIAVGWIAAYLPTALDAARKLGISDKVIAELSQTGDEIDVSDPHQRPNLLAIQRLLQHAFTTEVSARYYTPFFIVSRESHRPYWFLHLANSSRASDVVKTLHWEVENHFMHFGGPGLTMLGFDPHASRDQMRFAFDPPARISTKQALLSQLPARIAQRYPDGVPFQRLFEETSNETPATRCDIATAIAQLCQEGDLTKFGAARERRSPRTLPYSDDIVQLNRQIKLAV